MKIFIQIASYRDDDLVNTILNLLNNADNPSTLSFGICEQYSNKPLDYTYFNHQNIKVLALPYYNSYGACWARSLTQSLYDGEEFTLQIDSHTRCEKKWDSKLLDLFYSLNDDKAILSTYPSMFTPGQTYEEYNKLIYSCHVYGMKNGITKARPSRIKNKEKPIQASAIAAGFIFGPAQIINDVKYDPEFYFSGEEQALALRLFTHGYNLYHPNINLFYHYYTRKGAPKHWTDHSDWQLFSKRATLKLNCLLNRNGAFILGDFGLGSVRTLEDWRKYSGIDYINKKLHRYLIDNKDKPYPDEDDLWILEENIS